MARSRKETFVVQLLQLIDAALVGICFWLAGYARELVLAGSQGFGRGNDLTEMLWVLYIAIPLTPLALNYFHFYTRIRQKTIHKSVIQLLQALLILGIVIGLFAVFTKQIDTRRLILILGISFTFVAVFLRDRATRIWLKSSLRTGVAREHVIVAGAAEEIDDLLDEFGREATEDWVIVDRFDIRERAVEELYALLKAQPVSRVLFSVGNVEFGKLAQAVEACELQGVEAWISASFIRTQIARPEFDSVGQKPMLVLRSTPELSWELMCKGLLDRVGALLAIILSSPLWIIAAVGIAWKSPGAPIVFKQARAGRYGKGFAMYKFRTMVANAEELLEEIKASHGNEMEGPVFKLKKDPRVFPFGEFLRKLSIDELPQLLNVLMGDMSIVGPRPLPMYEVEAFRELSHRRRLSVKPGITCEWQVGGRNKITSFEEWVEMDLKYIDNWSLWLDLQIMLKTVPAVLLGRGAK